ncbi:MAG TPA: lipase maturation factor family protein [Candidatus Binatia bacterium]|nr:lipase maturation factor family protein [Candidatus Binatia bacterium]
MRPGSYWLTRFVLLRLLGFIYLAAFVSLVWQVVPLVGHDGLLPADAFLARVAAHYGSRGAGFAALPGVFWLDVSDRVLLGAAWLGVALSVAVLAGFANAILLGLLWALYLSFVHVGQDWYGYGWEILLLEVGLLAVFLCPLVDARPFPRRPPPAPVVWCMRWLVFRLMLGAGLIKLRGDRCWRELTCLDWHYETQPIPNPLSRTLHFLPRWFGRLGVVFNHLAELVVPWFVFGPRLVRHAAGIVLVAFQAFLIASGNLSFLNWLTLVPIVACFDDAFLARFLPKRLVARAERAAAEAAPARVQEGIALAVALVVAVLSVPVVHNMLSSRQIMNTSYNRLAFVNTYGMFGSVGRERREIVFEGTSDPHPGPDTVWKEYDFWCKPGDVARRPCVIAPLQPRLDWQIWFAAMSTVQSYPWTLHFVWMLLRGDPGTLRLLATNPFPDAPPRYVRARLYRYRFAPPGEPNGAWWTRTPLGDWLPPLSADDARFRGILRAHGWLGSGS